MNEIEPRPETSEVDRTFRDLEGNRYVVDDAFYREKILPKINDGYNRPRRLARYHAGSELEDISGITGNKCIAGFLNATGIVMYVLSVNAEGRFSFVGGSGHVFPDGSCSIS